MILKTALKHIIYEICINTLLSKIKHNFFNDTQKLHIGKQYKKIKILNRYMPKDQFKIIYDCIISDLSDEIITFNNIYKLVSYDTLPFPKIKNPIDSHILGEKQLNGIKYYTRTSYGFNLSISTAMNQNGWFIESFQLY